MRSQPTILHYHIFKNAGTSFNEALISAFQGRFREFDLPSSGDIISGAEMKQFMEEHPQAQAISSHQATLPAPSISGREVVTTLLVRDPLARIRSIYAFERIQQVQTPGAIKAKELDFKGFVEWRLKETPAVLCNFQVYFCARGKMDPPTIPGEAEFARACEKLEKIHVPGTVERYADWLQLAQAVLAASFPGIHLDMREANVTARATSSDKTSMVERLAEELGDSLVDRLIESNQHDMRLHQVAEAMMDRKRAEMGVGCKMIEAYRAAGVRE